MKPSKSMKISSKIVVFFMFFYLLMLGAGITGIYNMGNMSIATAPLSEQSAMGYIFFLSLLAVAGLTASILLVRRVTIQIKELSSFIKTNLVEKGDLTASFKTGTGDEIDQLAGDLNSFVENIHHYVARVTGTWESLSDDVEKAIIKSSQVSAAIARESELMRKIRADLRNLKLRSIGMTPETRGQVETLYSTFSMLTAVAAEKNELVASTGRQMQRIKSDTQQILEMVTQDDPSGTASQEGMTEAADGQAEFANREFDEVPQLEELKAKVEPEGTTVH